MRPNLFRWQWDGYPQFHGNKTNLLIHIIAVPSFVLSFFNVLWSAINLAWQPLAFSLGGMMIAFMAQAVGHGQEKNPAIPFNGPLDAVTRIFAEQLFTFPRFVVSGGWWRAFRAAPPE